MGACFITLGRTLERINIPLATFIHWHPLRVNDTAIVKVISALPRIFRADLAAFNRCRLFLGALFLSELATADIHSLDCDAWLGTRTRHTPFLWLYQPDPGPKSWRIWRRLLATAFLDTHHKRVTKTLTDLILECPLGDWLPGYSTALNFSTLQRQDKFITLTDLLQDTLSSTTKPTPKPSVFC
jgi:hypothetical protein